MTPVSAALSVLRPVLYAARVAPLSKTTERQPFIAIVDDDISVRRGLLRLLKAAGFSVSVYDSGESFLAQAAANKPECLILDVHLTGMSGPEVKMELNHRGQPVPTIFITAHEEEATRESLERFPGVPCLRKPFAASMLVDLIRESLSRG